MPSCKLCTQISTGNILQTFFTIFCAGMKIVAKSNTRMRLSINFILPHLIIVSFSTVPCVKCIANQGCRGIPKDEAEGIRCFLEPENPTTPVTRMDCSLNFNPKDKIRFQCDKFYKAVGLAGLEQEKKQEEEVDLENQHGGDFWRFSKCLGGDEWESLNSTVSFMDFRCELDKGFFDTADKSALISGGVEVAPTLMPWMTAIFQEGKYICGGTLIDLSFVLTAAHCTALNDSVGIGSSPPEQFTVVLGSSSGIFSQATDLKLNPHAQIFKVAQISMHPNYTGPPSYLNDIAILQLEKNVNISRFVTAVQFPKKSQIRSIEKGSFVLQVNGFGIYLNDSSAPSAKLRATNVTTKNFADCEQYERKFDRSCQFCGVPTGGDQRSSGICKGDSGSGAYIKDGRIGQERWSIQGLVSFGTSLLFKGCYNVTFFTKVEFYKSWIDEEKTRLAQQFRYGQDVGKPPKVEVTFERGKINLINNTFTIVDPLRKYLTAAHTVFITCSAPYPIKFVYKKNPLERNWSWSTNPNNPSMLIDDNNFVSYKDFYKTSTYIFKVRAKFGFPEFERQVNFSCESIEGPKRRQLIEFSDENHVDGDYRELTYKLHPQSKGQGPEEMTKDSAVRVSNESCNAFFYYQEVEDPILGFPTYAFYCERPDGSPGNLMQISCPTRAKCQNYFAFMSQTPKNCWRKLDPGSSIQKDGVNVITDFNFIPFIPVCNRDKRYPEHEVSLPVFYSLSDGFNTRPGIHFEGLQAVPESPELFRKFLELSSKSQQSMIYMKDFGHRHLLNSVVQIVCLTSHYWIAHSFQFAVQLANETDVRFLPVDETTDYDATLNANIQVTHVTLNDTRIEQIWCFGAIENTHDWLNASRPVKIFETEWDFLEANRQCSSPPWPNYDDAENQQTTEKLPELRVTFDIVYKLWEDKVVEPGAPPIIVKEFPGLGTDIHVKCVANYPIQIIQYVHDETKLQFYTLDYPTYLMQPKSDNRASARFSDIDVFVETLGLGNSTDLTNYTDRFFQVEAYFYHETSGQERIIRCESLENPIVQSSLEYSYSKGKQLLNISAVDPSRTRSKVTAEFCAGGEVEEGRECEAVFYYEERKDFPFYGFRCEFPFGRIGEVKLHPCDSPTHCLNLYRGRRQSSKCWKKSAGCSPTLNPCPDLTKIPRCQGKNCSTLIVPSTHQPFVATCIRGISGQPGYEETGWGNFIYFAGIPMDDTGNGFTAKLCTIFKNSVLKQYFGDWIETTKNEEDSLIYMEPFLEQQTVGSIISVTCRLSKYYAFDHIQFAVELRGQKQPKSFQPLDGNGGLASSWRHSVDGVRFWSRTKKIALDNEDIKRIYCFGRSIIGYHWLNASRPITLKNSN